ncbi:unnamed protein product [Orchesella dallaii]|uniref:Ceramide phosphoethanolamine synthase n=1 Tax=Orchesella dallaii TaxID=48710 RepID=A0ABP1QND2_9HEXA
MSKVGNVAWSWWPGLKETRGPVAFTILLALSAFFILELYLFTVVDSSPPGVVLPISTNSSQAPCHSSPFCVLDVKSLLLSPMDFYINKPVAILLNRALCLDSVLSANFVSFSHIMFSLASVRFLAHDSLWFRRLGVLLFLLRNLFDSLDGVIARADAEKLRIHDPYGKSQVPQEFKLPWTMMKPENIMMPDQLLPNSESLGNSFTFGYFIDGICDGIGCLMLMTACFLYLQRHAHRKGQVCYSPLSLVSVNGIRSSISTNTNGTISSGSGSKTPITKFDYNRPISKTFTKKVKDDYEEPAPPLYGISLIFSTLTESIYKFMITICSGISCGLGLPAVLYLFQLLLSSILWNRDILIYSKILEGSPADSSDDNHFKSKVIHSRRSLESDLDRRGRGERLRERDRLLEKRLPLMGERERLDETIVKRKV